MNKFILTLSLVLLFSCEATAQLGAEEKEKINNLCKQWDNKQSPGVVIGIIQEGELSYAKGYGMANMDYDVPLTADSKFYIASIAKNFPAPEDDKHLF